MFVDNLLQALVKKVIARRRRNEEAGLLAAQSGEVDAGHTNVVGSAKAVTNEDLEDCDVLPKYLEVPDMMDKVVYADRNVVAHESEGEFARFLLKPESKKNGEYDRWAPLFPYTYGKTVEELGEAEEANLADLKEWGF
ncbi:MAG: hypothetical protein M1832_005734 [Thelocarpon impressellum]|nr:MAG: hypothetical protein M1832_005734 [Thelocarpon impressellum]